MVETSEENGAGNDEKKSDGCENAVCLNEAPITVHIAKAIPHAYGVSTGRGRKAMRSSYHCIVW